MDGQDPKALWEALVAQETEGAWKEDEVEYLVLLTLRAAWVATHCLAVPTRMDVWE
jgi:hypothetical protein